MKAGAGPQLENGETLQDGAVWVKGQDGVLLRVPSTEQELNTTAFKKQNCIPNMGELSAINTGFCHCDRENIL